jgi:hypothetical protein
MSLVQIDRSPTAKRLRSFGWLLFPFAFLMGALTWRRTGQIDVALVIWTGGAVVAALYGALPAIRRPIYVGWMIAAFPVGWVVSRVIMALMYFGVVTPIGLIMRWRRGDWLGRQFDRSAQTYWRTRQPGKGFERYFRQY